MEALRAFKLKETELCQTSIPAICPYKFLPMPEELAPLTERRAREINKMDASVLTSDFHATEYAQWIFVRYFNLN